MVRIAATLQAEAVKRRGLLRVRVPGMHRTREAVTDAGVFLDSALLAMPSQLQ